MKLTSNTKELIIALILIAVLIFICLKFLSAWLLLVLVLYNILHILDYHGGF